MIYKDHLEDKLVLWDLARSFRQLSGEANSLVNGTFVHSEQYFTSYFHNRYSFMEDSVYLYSVSTPSPQVPEDWLTPSRFAYRLQIPQLFLSTNGVSVSPMTLVLYDPWLIITFNERFFVKSRAKR